MPKKRLHPPNDHPITAWRERRGLTQEALIAMTLEHMPRGSEISISKLSRLEGGYTHRPDPQFLKALQKVTRISIAEMI